MNGSLKTSLSYFSSMVDESLHSMIGRLGDLLISFFFLNQEISQSSLYV